jgi:hypothetical protein
MQPFIHDEIYSHQVSVQPAGEIWAALKAGADNHPPLDYWLRHLSILVLGDTNLGNRLPGVIYVCLASLLLFHLIRRHQPAVYALSGVILFLLICGFQDAFFIRSYALLVLIFMISLHSWDVLAEDRASRLHWIIFGLALLAAGYTHYYGVLFAVAFGMAALIQSFHERRLPIGTFALLAASEAAYLPLLPLMRTASRFSPNFYIPVTLGMGLDLYSEILTPVLPALVLMGVLTGIAAAYSKAPGNEPANGKARPGFPFPTVLALGSFACLPVVAFVVAHFTGALRARYLQGSGIAICVVAAAALAKIADEIPGRVRATIVIGVPMFFLGILVFREMRGIRFFQHYSGERTEQLKRLERAVGLPVVLAEEGVFIETTANYPDALRNTYFVYAALGMAQIPTIERSIIGLKTVMPLRSQDYDSFVKEHDSFAFVGLWEQPVLVRAFADKAQIEYHPANSDSLSYWIVRLHPERPARL